MERRRSLLGIIEAKLSKERAYLYDKPLEYKKLSEAGEDDMFFRMSSGRVFIVRKKDIERLKEILPYYLHDKLMIPILLELASLTPIRFRIVGGVWQKRVVKAIITGELNWRVDDLIGEREFRVLMKKVSSVVHVTLGGG